MGHGASSLVANIPIFGRSPQLQARQLRAAREALCEEDRRPEVASPEAVAAVAVALAGGHDLRGGVEREAPGALQPQLVRGAREELEEREAVAGRPVAEPRALGERPGGPDQLAAGEQQRVELGLAREAR